VKILAIRLARFGDVILLLPALTALKLNVPGSHLTFLTDHRLSSLAEMCPAIDKIISVDRIAMRDGSHLASLKSMCDVIREVRHRRFDLAIDFHGFRETNLLTWLSGSPKRLGLKRFDQSFLNFCFNMPPVLEDKSIHASEVFMEVAEAFRAPKIANKFRDDCSGIVSAMGEGDPGSSSLCGAIRGCSNEQAYVAARNTLHLSPTI
jgi:ADP-heptose:LPS heptosyltransferase